MKPAPQHPAKVSAFSLIELLVVIAIIGVLAGIALPSLRGITGTDKATAAATQFADDLSFARQRAINSRASVYVVFISPQLLNENWNGLNQDERKQLNNLLNGHYTAYGIFSGRALGDQPGPGTAQYLNDWQRLPDGIFFATNALAYVPTNTWSMLLSNSPVAYKLIPFPTARSKKVLLPCIGFNYQGQLINQVEARRYVDEYIYFSRGAVVTPKDAAVALTKPPQVVENPAANWTNNPFVRIDWLTGRSRVIHRQVL